LEQRYKTRCARRSQRRGPGKVTGRQKCKLLLATVPRCQQILRRGPARLLDDALLLQHFNCPVGHPLSQTVEHTLIASVKRSFSGFRTPFGEATTGPASLPSGCQMVSARKRRGLNSDARNADRRIIDISATADMSETPRSSRYSAHLRKLNDERCFAIVAAKASGRTLRHLAADINVSHQTIASIVRAFREVRAA